MKGARTASITLGSVGIRAQRLSQLVMERGELTYLGLTPVFRFILDRGFKLFVDRVARQTREP